MVNCPLFLTTLILSISSFLSGFLIFGFDVLFIINKTSNQTALLNIDISLSFIIFSIFCCSYNIYLISLFFINVDKQKYYISIMKRFKVYNGDYYKSHVTMMCKLLYIFIFIVVLSKLLGIIYIILEGKHLVKDVPHYQLFTIGFTIIFMSINGGLSCLGCIWIKENINEILPEYTEIESPYI